MLRAAWEDHLRPWVVYNPPAMKISQWIRDRRAAAGLTQAELAAKTGVIQPIVSQWERGVAEPGPIARQKLRGLFGDPEKSSSPPPSPDSKKPAKTADAAPESRAARGGRRAKASGNGSGANLGFEDKLWAAADKLRGHMDASEYKHVVLGLMVIYFPTMRISPEVSACRQIH